MRIAHNLMAMNNSRMLGINDKKKIGSAEKLSSGYKINRAADDAAGLAISEKMRRLIRGLDKGTENARDGVSWTQSGDGALNEVHDILHRMTELTVKALNETNTADDRMAMELEFEQLQSELDRITETTTFNEIPIFAKHEVPYYQCEGAAKWDSQQIHMVTTGENDLNFEYRVTEDEPSKNVSITVPPGRYTTQELIDEIETQLSEKATGKEKLVFEFTADGYCNANLEGGQVIDKLSGGLSYLMYDMYKGGSYGALIGTTSFPNAESRLTVVPGQNDYMEFSIEDFDGNSTLKQITIPQGRHTRSELIDMINTQLADTTVRATAYGDGIKLSSDDAMVTGFKGNMFKIDGSGTIYNSVFYDNVKYGSVTKEPAVFLGGCVLPTDSRDEEHKYYVIDASKGNNTLTLQPNKTDAPVTITIPDGRYDAVAMADTLNDLFRDAGLDGELKAERRSFSGFDGLKITSKLEGLDSKTGIDSSSGAYRTLFVERQYNQYGTPIAPENETTVNSEGSFKGSKDLSNLSSQHLTITTGVNDTFKLTIDNDTYDIALSQRTYDSVQDVVDEIDAQLNGNNALSGYKGKITVSQENNRILLKGADGAGVNILKAAAATGNDGFDAIFQGYNTNTSYPTVSGTGSVTLNTPYDGNIAAGEESMDIIVDGNRYTVNFPTGDLSQDDIKNIINNAIQEKTQTSDRIFANEWDAGDLNSSHFPASGSGNTSTTPWSNSATGSADEKEGVVDLVDNTAAKLTLGPSLQNRMTVTSANNTITLRLKNTTKTLTLDNGTYTKESLKDELQKKINEAFGTGKGGAVVSLNGDRLVITSRMDNGEDGRQTYIYCSTTNSSFLAELNTTRTAAVCTSDRALASSITIDSTNQQFSFTYQADGTTKNIDLTLTRGTYTRDSLVQEMNRQLSGTGVTASKDTSGRLVLTSTAVGSGHVIKYHTQTCGTAAEALFGALTNPKPAEIIPKLSTKDTITIEAGVSDEFSIWVDGVKQTVILDEGDYDRDSFVSMLNTKLAAYGVEAFKSGNNLGYRTTDVGPDAELSMTYAGGGSSMKAIYGSSTTTTSGVSASFNGDGKLVLSTTQSGSSIKVESSNGNGGAFQQPQISYTPINTTPTTGYHSAKNSYIDGVNLSGSTVTIDEWNNTLNFTFKDNGVNKDITVEITLSDPAKAYTFDELQTELQGLIDAAAGGSDKIKVTVSSSGVRLEAVKQGSNYQFSNFSGDFYDKVICSCTERTGAEGVSDDVGTQKTDGAYTVGRKSVKGGGVDIRQGISDELILDLTYGGAVHEISVKLDPGKYSGDELIDELQEKINEKLVNQFGLPENLIEVGIGGINTGVHGANDQNALNFSLSKTVTAPSEGQFIIDGVRGNAAFEIFYQTDGVMQPAYIMGTKNVAEGVTIPAGEGDLSLKVDGVYYDITIPEGEHTAQEILDIMNDEFNAAGAPVVAELENNRIKLTHKKLGEHEIDDIHGGARENIFFEEHGQKTPDEARYVKLSSEDGDSIGLKRHVLSSASMGLNSCCISQIKNAEKALVRLEQASRIVSDIRSDFGSTQNRLEHAINNNENKEENLQNAESVIRDTDMAEEMLKYSNANIISQAAQAMLAQANQSQQGVLSLLS